MTSVLQHLPPRLQRYSTIGATAVHEAGHAAMAFRLGGGIISATIVPSDVQGSLGCVRCTPIGGWFQPDAEVTRKVMNLVETLVMVSLAGSETQAEWLPAVPDAPADWREQLVVGAGHDMRNVLG